MQGRAYPIDRPEPVNIGKALLVVWRAVVLAAAIKILIS